MPFPKLSYLNVLRDEEIYPPFADIEEIVLTHETSKRALAIFTQPTVEALLVALLAIAVLWKPEWDGNQNGTLSDAFPAQNLAAKNSVPLAIVPQKKAPNSFVWHTDFAVGDKMQTTSNSDTNRLQKQTSPTPSTEVASSYSSIASSSAAASSMQSISAPIVSSSEENVNRNKWEGFISGSFMVPPSGVPANAYSTPWNGAVGMRYILTPQSSLIVELRKNSFISNTTRSVLSDSTVSLAMDGRTFQNEIGSTTSISNYSAESIVSLDFGYHYLLLSNALSPFVEILSGGSFSGIVTSESVGAEYSLSSFFFDAGLQADQLFATGNSPRRSLTAEIAVGFGW